MQIDWFTFVAQLVNFLILVWLLRRFLYAPVVRAMDRREADMAADRAEAEAMRQAAEEEAASFRALKTAFELDRAEQVNRVREEVSAHRRALLQEARNEVEQVQTEWHEAAHREREAYLEALRSRAGTQVLATARRVLRDLADEGVEAQIVRVFIDRLRTLGDEDRRRLDEALRAAGPGDLVVRSAFALSQRQRQAVAAALPGPGAGTVAPRFKTDPGLGAGIELTAGGWKMAWSMEGYLEALEDRLTAAFEQQGEQSCTPPHNP